MTDSLQYNDTLTGYVDTLGWLLKAGKKVPSRVGDTIEVEDVMIKLHDPRRAMPTNRPGYNKGFGLLEAAQLLSSKLALLPLHFFLLLQIALVLLFALLVELDKCSILLAVAGYPCFCFSNVDIVDEIERCNEN